MCSRRWAKSMGPTEIFLGLVGSSGFVVVVVDDLDDCLCGDRGRSTVFILELAVLALETGWRGRELLSGGDSFGGGAEMYALRRLLLLLLGVTTSIGGGLRLGVECD
jgi:hypothetical protein